MKSIRLFLTISIISAIILANFLAALHGYQESMQEAEVLFDQKLEDYSDFLATSTPTQIKSELTTPNTFQAPVIQSNAAGDAIIFQVRDENNSLLFQSNSFEKNQSTNEFSFNPKIENNYINFANFRWRSIIRHYPQNRRWVLVMEKQDVRYKLAESVILKSVYPIILAVPTIALIIFFIVKRGLKPVGLLATSVDEKQASNLSAIQIEDVPEELISLTQRINDLLFRLDSSLAREKRFASDAAHELRTPIAALNIQMKNLLDEGMNEQQSVVELSRGVKRMSHLVEQILMLNRVSPELYADQFKPVNLTNLLKELVAEIYPLIDQRGHDIELIEQNFAGISSHDCTVWGEEFSLHTLFKNLLVNAIKYTPKKGQLQLNVEQAEGLVTVTIMDSGPGIEPADRDRIFERFYRLDGDRNQSKVIGCGLGLSIVKQIANLHDAIIELSTSSWEREAEQGVSSGLCVKVIFKKQHSSG